MQRSECPACGKPVAPVGTKRGRFRTRDYLVGRCTCGFALVLDPDLDNDRLYDEAYYNGRGADPLINYVYEVDSPNTIRRYEWDAIEQLVGRLTTLDNQTRWLDLGCGAGGLVKHLVRRGVSAYGSDSGYGAKLARDRGVPMLDQNDLDGASASFDVVSAVEVLEHVDEPRRFLRQVSDLLRPGGVFFYTTGNAARARDLIGWSYLVPEIHISFYTPSVIERLFSGVGLEPLHLPYGAGHPLLIRYKVLKTLRVKDRHWAEHCIPWGLAGLLVDRLYGITELPLARKPSTSVLSTPTLQQEAP
jgi:YD repeat-containing protein